LGPGKTLAERIMPRPQPGRVGGQWIAWGVVLSAALMGLEWVALLSLPVFFLVWWGNYLKRRNTRRVIGSLPRLRAAPCETPDTEQLSAVTIIIPARNEEGGIEKAARSLALLDYPALEIIVVNDHSTDNTPSILNRLALEYPRIRLLHDPPLQPDWLGKVNAVWHAVQQADPESTWLLFADADVVFHPGAVRQAVSHAESECLDFLTCLPRLDTGSLCEELVLPLKWRHLISGVPQDKLNEPDTYPVGIGAFMLVRRTAYLRSGGHAVIRNHHADDTLLAGVIKQAGGKMGVAWTTDLLHIRFYRGWRQLREFSVRKVRLMGGDRLLYPISTLGLVVFPSLLPLPLALTGIAHQVLAHEFSAAFVLYSLGGLLAYQEMVRAHREAREMATARTWTAWLHPLGGVLQAWISVEAMVESVLNSRIDWRGRKTAQAPSDRR
jgi:hypothetical protein